MRRRPRRGRARARATHLRGSGRRGGGRGAPGARAPRPPGRLSRRPSVAPGRSPVSAPRAALPSRGVEAAASQGGEHVRRVPSPGRDPRARPPDPGGDPAARRALRRRRAPALPRRRDRPRPPARPRPRPARPRLHDRRPAGGDPGHRRAARPTPIWDQGERFGTIGVQRGGRTWEITTHRAEAYDPASRKPDVTFGDRVEDDLARRDFTVNAMALDPPGDAVARRPVRRRRRPARPPPAAHAAHARGVLRRRPARG